jgi:hypothetical protein|tara:strand:- start:221 stop:361 length:141 start_codon:yes stop_codon:yes gene_type:complete
MTKYLRHTDTNWQALITLGYLNITPAHVHHEEPVPDKIFLVMGLIV